MGAVKGILITVGVIIALVIITIIVFVILGITGIFDVFGAAMSVVSSAACMNSTGQLTTFGCCTSQLIKTAYATGYCSSNLLGQVFGCEDGGLTTFGECCQSSYGAGDAGWCSQCVDGSTGWFYCCNSTVGQGNAATGCTFCTTTTQWCSTMPWSSSAWCSTMYWPFQTGAACAQVKKGNANAAAPATGKPVHTAAATAPAQPNDGSVPPPAT